MASSKSDATPAGIKPKNKLRRQAAYLSIKKAKEFSKRDERMRRKREEAKNPVLAQERRANNVPVTIDNKRTWDDGGGFNDESEALGWAIDVGRLAKKRKVDHEEAEAAGEEEEGPLEKLKRREHEEATRNKDKSNKEENEEEEEEEEEDSMLDSDSEDDETTAEPSPYKDRSPKQRERSPSVATSVATMQLNPDFLKTKFPSLFTDEGEPTRPKILITTSINSSLHDQAEILTSLFPNSTYIRRSKHAHAHQYSVREIATFATARSYTHLLILEQNLHNKLPGGLSIIHLPGGPHFHFSLTNWIQGKKLPGHGNPTGHDPELILNGFKTPLGVLTGKLLSTLWPPSPELEGRTVVTCHNQRDYIFFRRHRYVFRDKKASEKSVVGTDGKNVPGVEDIKPGLQELGPRFTLKLRRIDRGVQWKSGQEWEWKGKMDKKRTRFNL